MKTVPWQSPQNEPVTSTGGEKRVGKRSYTTSRDTAETFEFVEPAASTDLEAVVVAFDVALGKTLKRIVEWSLTRVQPESPRAGRR